MSETIAAEVITTCIYMFGAILGGVVATYILGKLLKLAKSLFAGRLEI